MGAPMSKPAHDSDATVRAISRALWAGESPERLVPQLLRLAGSAEPASEPWCFAQRHLALAWAPIRPWRASLRARELLAVDPTDHAAWAALGLAQSIIHNHRYAIRCYERALKIAPAQPRYAHNLGHLYDVVLDDPAASLPLLGAAYEAEPRSSDVAASYAHALARTGEVERALDVLRGALTNGATRDQAELLRFLEAEAAKKPSV
jgi:tetratricopeptide (TPR) repeat protein